MKLRTTTTFILLLLCDVCVSQTLLINEIDADQTGTDTQEFIELYDGGVGNVSLDGLCLVFYNGSNDLSYWAFDLDGYTTNPQGYFVLGNVPQADLAPGDSTDWIQNGQDAIALYRADAVDFPNGTGVTEQNLVDAIVYDTDDADDPGLLVLLQPGEPQVNENMRGNKDTESLQRSPDGSGSSRQTATFRTAPPTPGNANPLPITISSLSATQISSGRVRLRWTTETEVNNFGFTVERKATSEQNFTELPGSFVPGNGTTTTPRTYDYVDSASPGGLLQYRIHQTDLDGTSHYSATVEIDVTTHIAGYTPGRFFLSQNYPNPFNPVTHIEFSVPMTLSATVTLVNIIGQEVDILFKGLAEAGKHYTLEVNAGRLPGGVYLYRLESAAGSLTRKLIVLK